MKIEQVFAQYKTTNIITALKRAVFAGDIPAFEAILEAKPDIDINMRVSATGLTLLQSTLIGNTSEKRKAMIGKLLLAGADPSLKDSENKSAFDYLNTYVDDPVEKFSLTSGFNIALRNLELKAEFEKIKKEKMNGKARYKLSPILLTEAHIEASAHHIVRQKIQKLVAQGYKTICLEFPYSKTLEEEIKRIKDMIEVTAERDTQVFDIIETLSKSGVRLLGESKGIYEHYRTKAAHIYSDRVALETFEVLIGIPELEIVFFDPKKSLKFEESLDSIKNRTLFEEDFQAPFHVELRDIGMYYAFALAAEKRDGGVIGMVGLGHGFGIASRFKKFFDSIESPMQFCLGFPFGKGHPHPALEKLYQESLEEYGINEAMKRLEPYSLECFDLSAENYQQSLERFDAWVAGKLEKSEVLPSPLLFLERKKKAEALTVVEKKLQQWDAMMDLMKLSTLSGFNSLTPEQRQDHAMIDFKLTLQKKNHVETDDSTGYEFTHTSCILSAEEREKFMQDCRRELASAKDELGDWMSDPAFESAHLEYTVTTGNGSIMRQETLSLQAAHQFLEERAQNFVLPASARELRAHLPQVQSSSITPSSKANKP